MRSPASAATLAGCGAIGLWAFLALLSRAASGLPPLELTALSFAVSGAAGLAFLAVTGRARELQQPALVWTHGVGGLFLYHALYFAAFARAPAAAVNLINYMWPLLIVLLSGAILGLRLSWQHMVGTGLALAGCAALLGGGMVTAPGAGLGYALAAGAAITWAVYSVLSRRLQAVPLGAMAGFCAATAVLAGVLHLLSETTVTPDTVDWAMVALMGLGPLGAAFVLWDVGMKRGDPRLLGTLAFATPVLSTLLLAAGGYVTLSATVLAAAALVAAGGLVAAFNPVQTR